jgi:hypothetical protein
MFFVFPGRTVSDIVTIMGKMHPKWSAWLKYWNWSKNKLALLDLKLLKLSFIQPFKFVPTGYVYEMLAKRKFLAQEFIGEHFG